jgi:hypothetical protein
VNALEKTCPSCSVAKRRSEFSESPTARDGLQSWCKECKRVAWHARYSKSAKPASFPVCFSAAQYQNWSQVAATVPPKPELGFCEDCTSEYQARMGRQGKCARPDVQFVKGAAVVPPPATRGAAAAAEHQRKQETAR